MPSPGAIFLSILDDTQQVVTTLTLIAILRIRNAHSLWFGLGTLVAAFSAKILKLFIRQPRPSGARKFERTYGMPSTHSSSIAFFGVYLSLSSLLLPLHPRVTSLLPFWDAISRKSALDGTVLWSTINKWGQNSTRVALATFWLIAAGSVCWSRIRLGHHTQAQVLVGASLGSAVALLWLCVWLGPSELFSITGAKHLAGPWRNNTSLPEWLPGGVREHGLNWERAFEDSLFVFLEAWKEGRIAAVKDLASFPFWTKATADEL